jgi:hypothetical protein
MTFDFENIHEKFLVTKEFIESRLSAEEIYQRYLGVSDFRKAMHSPFGPDKTPSFRFHNKGASGKLQFRDFSSGHKGDCFDLVALLNPTESFPQILERIAKDFGLLNGKNVNTQLVKKIYSLPDSKPAEIKVIPKEFEEHELNYWKQFNIDLKILQLYNVKAVKECWVNDSIFYTFKKSDPCFRYTRENGFKIYRPLADKKFKWRTNLGISCIWGLEQLSYKKELKFLIN